MSTMAALAQEELLEARPPQELHQYPGGDVDGGGTLEVLEQAGAGADELLRSMDLAAAAGGLERDEASSLGLGAAPEAGHENAAPPTASSTTKHGFSSHMSRPAKQPPLATTVAGGAAAENVAPQDQHHGTRSGGVPPSAAADPPKAAPPNPTSGGGFVHMSAFAKPRKNRLPVGSPLHGPLAGAGTTSGVLLPGAAESSSTGPMQMQVTQQLQLNLNPLVVQQHHDPHQLNQQPAGKMNIANSSSSTTAGPGRLGIPPTTSSSAANLFAPNSNTRMPPRLQIQQQKGGGVVSYLGGVGVGKGAATSSSSASSYNFLPYTVLRNSTPAGGTTTTVSAQKMSAKNVANAQGLGRAAKGVGKNGRGHVQQTTGLLANQRQLRPDAFGRNQVSTKINPAAALPHRISTLTTPRPAQPGGLPGYKLGGQLQLVPGGAPASTSTAVPAGHHKNKRVLRSQVAGNKGIPGGPEPHFMQLGKNGKQIETQPTVLPVHKTSNLKLTEVAKKVRKRRDAEGRLELDHSRHWKDKLVDAINWLKKQEPQEVDLSGLADDVRATMTKTKFNAAQFFSELPVIEDYPEMQLDENENDEEPPAQSKAADPQDQNATATVDVVAQENQGDTQEQDKTDAAPASGEDNQAIEKMKITSADDGEDIIATAAEREDVGLNATGVPAGASIVEAGTSKDPKSSCCAEEDEEVKADSDKKGGIVPAQHQEGGKKSRHKKFHQFDWKCLSLNRIVEKLQNKQPQMVVDTYYLVDAVKRDVHMIQTEMSRVFGLNHHRQYIVHLACELFEELEFYAADIYQHELKLGQQKRVAKAQKEQADFQKQELLAHQNYLMLQLQQDQHLHATKQAAAVAPAGGATLPLQFLCPPGAAAANGIQVVAPLPAAASSANSKPLDRRSLKRPASNRNNDEKTPSSSDNASLYGARSKPKKAKRKAQPKKKTKQAELLTAADEDFFAKDAADDTKDHDGDKNSAAASSKSEDNKSSVVSRKSANKRANPKKKSAPYQYSGNNKNLDKKMLLNQAKGGTQLSDSEDDEDNDRKSSVVGKKSSAGTNKSNRRKNYDLRMPKEPQYPPSKGGITPQLRTQTAGYFGELKPEHQELMHDFVRNWLPSYDEAEMELEIWDFLPTYQKAFAEQVKKYHRQAHPEMHKKQASSSVAGGAASKKSRLGVNAVGAPGQDGADKRARYANGELISDNESGSSSEDVLFNQRNAKKPKRVVDSDSDDDVPKFNFRPRPGTSAANDAVGGGGSKDSNHVTSNAADDVDVAPLIAMEDDGMFANVIREQQQQQLQQQQLEAAQRAASAQQLQQAAAMAEQSLQMNGAGNHDRGNGVDALFSDNVMNNDADLQDMMGYPVQKYRTRTNCSCA
ncbi:unnamed protein product [Amoebophrya sp. A120]|nr:unnamed protein product [Amoebophrya sp. A120]|eukprot:GSA120T00005863001.1